jgi:adenylosuccinate lyase
MRTWQERSSFHDLLAGDPAVTAQLSAAELRDLFDYGYYLKHVDAAFERLGLLPPGYK